MRKVAVFGNAGGGKSTLARRVAELTRLPLFPLDAIQYWERFATADTLVYVDLPLFTHYRWVTKRLVKAPFVAPEGWPDNSPR